MLHVHGCLPHGSGKAVAAFRDGLDIWLAIIDVSQCLAQDRDVMPEIAFLNEGVGPDCADQFVPGDKHPALVHQHN